MFDLILKNGTVYDGTGASGQRVDVGVRGGHIEAVGDLGNDATEVIDCSGLTVAPGFIETDMTASLGEKARDAMVGQIPLGRAGTPDEVAAVVEFLASAKAAYLTGQVLHVSGGLYV